VFEDDQLLICDNMKTSVPPLQTIYYQGTVSIKDVKYCIELSFYLLENNYILTPYKPTNFSNLFIALFFILIYIIAKYKWIQCFKAAY